MECDWLINKCVPWQIKLVFQSMVSICMLLLADEISLAHKQMLLMANHMTASNHSDHQMVTKWWWEKWNWLKNQSICALKFECKDDNHDWNGKHCVWHSMPKEITVGGGSCDSDILKRFTLLCPKSWALSEEGPTQHQCWHVTLPRPHTILHWSWQFARWSFQVTPATVVIAKAALIVHWLVLQCNSCHRKSQFFDAFSFGCHCLKTSMLLHGNCESLSERECHPKPALTCDSKTACHLAPIVTPLLSAVLAVVFGIFHFVSTVKLIFCWVSGHVFCRRKLSQKEHRLHLHIPGRGVQGCIPFGCDILSPIDTLNSQGQSHIIDHNVSHWRLVTNKWTLNSVIIGVIISVIIGTDMGHHPMANFLCLLRSSLLFDLVIMSAGCAFGVNLMDGDLFGLIHTGPRVMELNMWVLGSWPELVCLGHF